MLYNTLIIFLETFAGLAFETLPFLILGTFLSSAIHVFIPPRRMQALFPRNRILSLLMALLIGLILPVCECAIVPLSRRLREKGIRTGTVLAFFLAAPIVNPLAIISTAVAFPGTKLWLLRPAMGMVCALLIALIVEFLLAKRGESTVYRPRPAVKAARSPCGIKVPGPQSYKKDRRALAAEQGKMSTLTELSRHTADEFLDTSRFLIGGIFLAAILRALLTAIPALNGAEIPAGAPGSAVGAILAWTLSLCSSSDAFVARSLFGFSAHYALFSFLVLGPMLDLKNTILLSRFLTKRELAILALLIITVTLSVTALTACVLGGL